MNEQENTSKGMRIKQLRERHGWSQMQLAENVEVSMTTVSNWETGKAEPKSDSVVKLAKVFNESPLFILTGERFDTLDPIRQQAVDDALLRALQDSVDSVQAITIQVENRGFLSLEIGIYAFSIAVIALAFSWLTVFSRTMLSTIVFIILILFGLWFSVFGKALLKRLEKRAREERLPKEK